MDQLLCSSNIKIPNSLYKQVVTGTGHRPSKLGGFKPDLHLTLYQFLIPWLQSLQPCGVISGMALGFDLALAEAASQLKIPFVAAVPFKGQESIWPENSQRLYKQLLSQANKVIIISPTGYSPVAMRLRNRWMCNKADIVLALWNGESGSGTANCLRYATSLKLTIINTWQQWQDYTQCRDD
jgi:uncharacterized phage-like protein YoqJ